jgi:hypothetical protein
VNIRKYAFSVAILSTMHRNSGKYLMKYYFYYLPDIPTAVGAKEALEGHCIYDGGFCKLHLSYSRHTDLNVKVFSLL